jgi:hypothetical protein
MTLPTPPRFVLRDLPLATRLVLAVFLVAVGIGYFSALVQLHFQHAARGTLLPGLQETQEAYFGTQGHSELERLLTADESKPFNGSGTMRTAFTSKSAGWTGAIKRFAKAKKVDVHKAEEELRSERDGERLALLDWLRAGANQEQYDKDRHPLTGELASHSITDKYVEEEGKQRFAKIQTILEDRCVRCHSADKAGVPAQIPLDSYEEVHEYAQPERAGGISLTRLAQTTHAHLLSFAMLFGMTGVIFSLTSYPGWVRGFFAPYTLTVQLVDVSFWWVSRADPAYTQVVMVTGGLVAVGLVIHILGSLFNMFGTTGKLLLLGLIVGTAVGGFILKERVVDPFLLREKSVPDLRDVNHGLDLHAPAVARLPNAAQKS